MIFGRAGSGKSTFAKYLHSCINIPLYHLDHYYFDANWKKRNNNLFMKDQKNLVSQDAWIIDGNAIKSLETRYACADLCLYFNINRWLCYWRLFKRCIKKDNDRPKNCPERITWKLIQYNWSFEKRVNNLIERLKQKYPKVKFFIITNSKQMAEIKKNIISTQQTP